MTSRSLGFLSAAAALAMFSGLQFEIATGWALERLAPNDARLQTGRTVAGTVNRALKRDRAERSASTAELRTIVFQHPNLQSTTVALRMTDTVNATKNRPMVKPDKPAAARPKPVVACEGVVSVLTEVAKQLEAGRCVT